VANNEELNVWLGFQEGHDQPFIDALFAIQGSIEKLADAMTQIAEQLAAGKSQQ
jgi:hypothetical protein